MLFSKGENKNGKTKINWDEYESFFTEFNPFQYSKHIADNGVHYDIYELLKGKLFINTTEKKNEFIIEVMLPANIDYDKVEHKVITKHKRSGKKYNILQVEIPKKQY